MPDPSPSTRVVLVCFAVAEERKFFKPLAARCVLPEVCITGIGRTNAANSVRRRLSAQLPSLVLSCGFAGGLNPALARNTIVFSADANMSLSRHLAELGAKLWQAGRLSRQGSA